MKLLNRQGFDSNRNLAKPMRSQRVRLVNGQFVINPLDNLPLRADGQPTNTTGCFGTRSTFSVHACTVIKKGAPGKVKYGGGSRGRGVRRVSTLRNPGLGLHDHTVAEFQEHLKQHVLSVRNRVENACLMAEARWSPVPYGITVARGVLNDKLKELLLPQEMLRVKAADQNRWKTVLGMARKGQIDKIKLNNLIRDVDRVLHAIRSGR